MRSRPERVIGHTGKNNAYGISTPGGINNMSSNKPQQASLGSLLRSNIRNYSMIMVLALILIVFAFFTEGVNLNSRNITNIFMQSSYILLLAVGMMMVIILGNIDLSVGSFVGMTGAIAAMLYNSGIGIVPTFIIVLTVGALIGSFQAFFHRLLQDTVVYRNPCRDGRLSGSNLYHNQCDPDSH